MPRLLPVSHTAQGRSGPEGSKFVVYTEFTGKLEAELPNHRFEHLTENVRMQDRSEISYFSERLKCAPILLDSADLGLVNRPRLWWTCINWSQCQVRINPITQKPMRWTKVDKLFRLHLDVDYTEASSIDTGDLQFDQSIAKRQTHIPCFTTPAPTSEGRSAPQSLRGKIHPEVKQRWLQDNRQYAPWCYLRDGDSSLSEGAAPWIPQRLHQGQRGHRAIQVFDGADPPERMQHDPWHYDHGASPPTIPECHPDGAGHNNGDNTNSETMHSQCLLPRHAYTIGKRHCTLNVQASIQDHQNQD